MAPDYHDKNSMKEAFPSNKKTSPLEHDAKKKEIKKVVSGQAKRHKCSFGERLAETFLEDNTKTVGKYVFNDVLIPAAKSMICDIVGWGGFAEMLLFGSIRGSRGSRTSSGIGVGSHTNYGAYSSGKVNTSGRGREMSRTARARHDFDGIDFETRGDADEVLANLVDLIVDYGEATVADFYGYAGIDSSFTDTKYGWTDLSSACVTRVRGGYLLNLPKPQALD